MKVGRVSNPTGHQNETTVGMVLAIRDAGRREDGWGDGDDLDSSSEVGEIGG